jgi:uncharacterized membrane-anchored protein
MNNHKIFLFMERAWLTVAVIGIISAAYFFAIKDQATAFMMLIITFAGGAMWALRRSQRKKS